MNKRQLHNVAVFALWLAMAAAMLLAATPSRATEVTVYWEAPVTRENGDTLTPAELGPYTLYLYEGQQIVHKLEIQPDENTVLVENLEQYTASNIGMTITASDTMGLKSKHSARVNFNINRVSAPVIILRWGE